MVRSKKLVIVFLDNAHKILGEDQMTPKRKESKKKEKKETHLHIVISEDAKIKLRETEELIKKLKAFKCFPEELSMNASISNIVDYLVIHYSDHFIARLIKHALKKIHEEESLEPELRRMLGRILEEKTGEKDSR